MSMRKVERSIDRPDRQWIAWRSPGHFTKNPDIIRMGDGRMLFVYNETNQHWPTEYTRVTVVESLDGGRTWGSPQVLDESWPGRGEERWVTPRMSLLSDGRVAVLCDTNDFHHCHESQPSGTWIWWSHDGGRTWSEKQLTGIPGIEPDRIVEKADGTLIVCAHYMFRATRRLGMFTVSSRDGGKSWGDFTVIASDRVHNYCEGNLYELQSGRWLCIMRENNHNNYPCYLAFSDDDCATWSEPVPAPFSGDRPFARQLRDGRTLVTYRNQAGTPGLYAWLGDIESESGYKLSKSLFTVSHSVARQQDDGYLGTGQDVAGAVELTGEGLGITGVQGRACRYMLYPPESFFSDMVFRAEIRAEGDDTDTVFELKIARINMHVWVRPDGVYAGPESSIDLTSKKDMRGWYTLVCRFVDGLFEVFLDGVNIIRGQRHVWDAPLCASFFGGGEGGGKVWIRSMSYDLTNPADGDIHMSWDASSGVYPDQYAVDRWLQMDFNGNTNPDHGYSTWLEGEDGEILVLDYTNKGAENGKAHIKGYRLLLSDFEQ